MRSHQSIMQPSGNENFGIRKHLFRRLGRFDDPLTVYTLHVFNVRELVVFFF